MHGDGDELLFLLSEWFLLWKHFNTEGKVRWERNNVHLPRSQSPFQMRLTIVVAMAACGCGRTKNDGSHGEGLPDPHPMFYQCPHKRSVTWVMLDYPRIGNISDTVALTAATSIALQGRWSPKNWRKGFHAIPVLSVRVSHTPSILLSAFYTLNITAWRSNLSFLSTPWENPLP